MATTKSKKAVKKSSKPASKSAVTKKTKVAKVVEAPVATQTSKNPFKGFFARKYDANETILTIFKSPKIYGAIVGEVVGTMLLTIILLTLGANPLYVMFGAIAISAAVLAFSGAHLNPLVTVGMMASRRISVIRGVVYMLAQVLGAWFAYLISSAFINTADGAATAELQSMTAIPSEKFWVVTMIEFFAATMIAFFFARAHAYKRSTLTFAAIYGTGICTAILTAVVISSSLGMQNNFIANPAVALMYQVLPTGGENFGVVLGDIFQALAVYVILPMIGGVIGFAISDVATKLSGNPVCACGAGCPCKDEAKAKK